MVGISRELAFDTAAREAKEHGEIWARDPAPDIPDVLRDGNIYKIQRIYNKVDEADSWWESDRQFGEVFDALFAHAEWMMRLARNRHVAQRLNLQYPTQPNAEAVKSHLLSAFQAAGFMNSRALIEGSTLDPWLECFGRELAKEWLLRGGATLPEVLVLSILTTAETITTTYDFEAEYGYDEDGLPTRGTYDSLCGALENICRQHVLNGVSRRLGFTSKPWDDFDLFKVIDRAVLSMGPLIDATRAAEAKAEKFAAELASADSSLKEWQRFHHRPLISPYGLNPDEAERWVCDWMLHMGAKGAKVTQYVGDGGIDVQADRYLAQVKMYAGSVGIASIREFAGVTFLDEDERRALFFTTGTYPLSAPALADRANMALFHFDLKTGTVTGKNSLGELYAAHGFITER